MRCALEIFRNLLLSKRSNGTAHLHTLEGIAPNYKSGFFPRFTSWRGEPRLPPWATSLSFRKIENRNLRTELGQMQLPSRADSPLFAAIFRFSPLAVLVAPVSLIVASFPFLWESKTHNQDKTAAIRSGCVADGKPTDSLISANNKVYHNHIRQQRQVWSKEEKLDARLKDSRITCYPATTGFEEKQVRRSYLNCIFSPSGRGSLACGGQAFSFRAIQWSALFHNVSFFPRTTRSRETLRHLRHHNAYFP